MGGNKKNVELLGLIQGDPRDLLVAHMVYQPIGTEQHDIARLELLRERIDLDGRVGADRAIQQVALRVGAGLFGRDLADIHEPRDQADLVGYSMGAFICHKFAAAYPGRVKSVILGGAGWLQAGPATEAMESISPRR